MKRQNVRTLSLIVCTVTYLFVGAAVFDALESENEDKLRAHAIRTRDRLIAKYNVSAEDYRIFESIISKAIPHKAGHQWKFLGSLFFAVSVITTIGYGSATPQTYGGRIFCMLYALAGIPLGLVMFQAIGERLNTFSARVLRGLKRSIGHEAKVTQIDLILVCTILSLAIILFGAAVFNSYESWTYFESVYYCLLTVLTVGLGDFVALQQNDALNLEPNYVIFSIIFIVCGLTVISAAINLLVLRFLTLNTEDEIRDRKEEKLAARGYVSINNLRGRRKYSQSHDDSSLSDASSIVAAARPAAGSNTTTTATQRIRPATNGNHLVPQLPVVAADADTISVHSCSCYQATSNLPTTITPSSSSRPYNHNNKSQKRFSTGRRPTLINTTTAQLAVPAASSYATPAPSTVVVDTPITVRRRSDSPPSTLANNNENGGGGTTTTTTTLIVPAAAIINNTTIDSRRRPSSTDADLLLRASNLQMPK